MYKGKNEIILDKINTSFLGINIPKESTSYKCLSLIMLYSDY